MVSLAMILHDHGSLGKILARSCQDLGEHTHASWQACQDSCHWELTKVNENKQKLTPTAAWSGYLLCRSFSRYQPSYHVLKFTTLCCHIFNTSKNDSVAGSANNSKILVNKIDVFVLQLIHSLDTLDKTLTKNSIKKFKRFVWSKNKQDLIKSFKSKREYVRICKILARVPRVFTLGNVTFIFLPLP